MDEPPIIDETWVSRASRLGRPDDWDDDMDIIDADERIAAAEMVTDAPGALSPSTAVELLTTPPTPQVVAGRRWVNPYESLLDELRRTVAHVMAIEIEVRELDANGGAHRTSAGRWTLGRYERERDRQIQVSSTAIRLGIAERTVRMVEREVEDIARMVASAATRAGLSSENRRALMLELAAEVRARRRSDVSEARALADAG